MKVLSIPILLPVVLIGSTALAQPYSPPPAESVKGYYTEVLPCTQHDNPMTNRAEVSCKDNLLLGKSMRELAIMRNTIFARYGWDGFRKEWLRAYFHAQPWFKPNPKFSYKQLSEIDRKNAHLIGVHEHSMTERELRDRKNDILARYGKVWGDIPVWTVKGKKVKSCTRPAGAEEDNDAGDWEPLDCKYQKRASYKPNPSFKESMVSAEDRIELGLLDRSLGNFATDSERRDKVAGSAEVELFKIDELRQLSLRDLRILRNTIYARHGRKFKSKILQDHFAGMSWYKLDPNYSDATLTKTDQRNIALIKTVENEFGGPITDEEHLIEPATDGA